jgi:hypothetical protein
MPAKILKKLRHICKLWENREVRLEEICLPRRESCDRCMALGASGSDKLLSSRLHAFNSTLVGGLVHLLDNAVTNV